MAKVKSINLLPQEEFDSSTMGIILRWAMSSFRIIVIVTEMIVMAAFLSRFYLDYQNSNLGDSIKVASAQIAAQSDFENEFRGVQQKLNIFNQVTGGPQATANINLIASATPQDITLSSVSIQNNEILIKGLAGNEVDIAQFISNLKAQTSFKDVELTSVGSSDQEQLSLIFLIDVTY